MNKTYAIVVGVAVFFLSFYLITYLLGEPIKINYGIPDFEIVIYRFIPSLILAVLAGLGCYKFKEKHSEDRA